MSTSPIFVLLLVAFLDAVGIGLVYPLFSALLFDPTWNFVASTTSDTTRGLSLGILLATMPLVQMIVSPFFGSLSDRIGRRPVILGTISCAVFGYLVATFSISYQSLFGLFISRALLGISAASYSAANASVADIYEADHKAQYFAKMSMMFGAGFAVGPLLGGIVTCETMFWSLSYARPFIFAGMLSLCSIFAVLRYLPETLKKKEACPTKMNSIFQDLVDIDLRMLLVLGAIFILCFGWAFYSELIPVLWITTFKMTPKHVGLFFAYGAFWYMIFSKFIPRLAIQKFSYLQVFEIAAFALCGAIWILFMYQTQEVYWIAIPLQNLALSCFFPISATALSELAPKDQQGKVMGLHLSAESLGIGIGPLLSGALVGISLFVPIIVGGFAAFCAGAIIHYIRKSQFSENTVN